MTTLDVNQTNNLPEETPEAWYRSITDGFQEYSPAATESVNRIHVRIPDYLYKQVAKVALDNGAERTVTHTDGKPKKAVSLGGGVMVITTEPRHEIISWQWYADQKPAGAGYTDLRGDEDAWWDMYWTREIETHQLEQMVSGRDWHVGGEIDGVATADMVLKIAADKFIQDGCSAAFAQAGKPVSVQVNLPADAWDILAEGSKRIVDKSPFTLRALGEVLDAPTMAVELDIDDSTTVPLYITRFPETSKTRQYSLVWNTNDDPSGQNPCFLVPEMELVTEVMKNMANGTTTTED